MEFTGKFIGSLTYISRNKDYHGKMIHFEMNLKQSANLVHGTSQDISGFGTHPDPASIRGKIDGTKLKFIKQYPTAHYLNNKNEHIIDNSKNGPEIHYSGVVDDLDQSISGDWHIKFRVYLFGFIPIKMTQIGTWQMAPE